MRKMILAIPALSLFALAAVADAEEKQPTGVAVVELFTSQGCSSCPPADRVLAAIEAEAQKKQLPVFVLSMHVDYWNSLGWTDPYSSREFTDRQRDYAQAWQSKRVYTPQMVVNGRTEFVGSRRQDAIDAIRNALRRKATATLTLKSTQTESGESINLDYKVDGEFQQSNLIVCLVGNVAENDVARGENAGAKLSHQGVVFAMQSISIPKAGQGSVELPLPPALVKKGKSPRVVAFVQHDTTREIYGAAAVSLTRDAGRRVQ